MNENQLRNEKSVYLKNNSSSSINWIPYSLENLKKAQLNQKPVLMSLGESFSRWAQMMDSQAFQDNHTAEFLNEHFLCFKIDRNELPNLFHYFQKASHIFNNPIYNPEIPLTVFLNNELKPFYVGGLYSSSRIESSPALIEVLREIKITYDEAYQNIQQNIVQSESILSAPNNIKEKINYQGHFPPPEMVLNALAQFKDHKNGGFGNQPKFPTFSFYQWCIEQILEGMIQKENAEFIIKSIEQMIMGGVVDHVRGGVFEYAQDEQWQVPNFVKKLTIQASYISMLSKFSLLYPSPLVYDSLIDTMKYLKEEMLKFDEEVKEDVYFFSKQDSVSENIEGLFYTFTFEEFEDAISKYDDENGTLSRKLTELTNWFTISNEGNYQNKLNVINFNPAFKNTFYEQENWSIVRLMKKAIEKERKNRIPPKTDPQGIASWNFKIITSLVDVIQYVKIDVIKKMASDLINLSLQGVTDSFLVQSERGLTIRHTTTNSLETFLLEDLVAFAEMQIRLFEISSNKIFKQNFMDLMKIINEEFYYDHRLNLIGKSNSIFPAHFKIESDFQDKEMVSSVATYTILLKKFETLYGSEDSKSSLSEVIERLKQIILTNPLAAGEGLRSVTYPDEAYRKILVPSVWSQKTEFQELLQYFLHRFVIDYHDNDQGWEIKSLTGVELKGSTLEELSSSLRPDKGKA